MSRPSPPYYDTKTNVSPQQRIDKVSEGGTQICGVGAGSGDGEGDPTLSRLHRVSNPSPPGPGRTTFASSWPISQVVAYGYPLIH